MSFTTGGRKLLTNPQQRFLVNRGHAYAVAKAAGMTATTMFMANLTADYLEEFPIPIILGETDEVYEAVLLQVLSDVSVSGFDCSSI